MAGLELDITGDVPSDDGRTKGGVFMAVMFENADFDLTLTNGTSGSHWFSP
jgi:hypothetical protein